MCFCCLFSPTAYKYKSNSYREDNLGRERGRSGRRECLTASERKQISSYEKIGFPEIEWFE